MQGHTLPTTALSYYSPDYFTARRRFVAACDRLGFESHALPVEAPSPTDEPLTIDVAIAGAAEPERALILSSGVHGVEGFFGSAVQLAFLEQLPTDWRPPPGGSLVLLHALNPFGFAWQRRFNEENVDLNRNFLLEDDHYAGSPPLCGAFRRMMLPGGPRIPFDLWPARLALLALRHGTRSFWETLPVGQYDFPDWLFFGGQTRTQTAQLLDRFLPGVLSAARETVHLDLHTGLGRWMECQLLLCGSEAGESSWWRTHFGAKHVRETQPGDRSYLARGSFGPWLRARFPQCRYRYATAEFGTYSPARVIRALAEELRWHAKLGPQGADHWARRRLTDIFVPKNRRWRTDALENALAVTRRAEEALWPPVEADNAVRQACRTP